jgi:putative endonuclease
VEYVYILKSINFLKTYVGHTSDINLRLIQHNAGYSKYTSKYKPWKIIYTEIFPDSIVARKREKYLKSAVGRRWIKREIFSKIQPD